MSILAKPTIAAIPTVATTVAVIDTLDIAREDCVVFGPVKWTECSTPKKKRMSQLQKDR